MTSLRLQCQWKKFGVYQCQFWSKGSCILTKNVPSKTQLTLQMTWQEGKSEDFREILCCDKRNKMLIMWVMKVLKTYKYH